MNSHHNLEIPVWCKSCHPLLVLTIGSMCLFSKYQQYSVFLYLYVVHFHRHHLVKKENIFQTLLLEFSTKDKSINCQTLVWNVGKIEERVNWKGVLIVQEYSTKIKWNWLKKVNKCFVNFLSSCLYTSNNWKLTSKELVNCAYRLPYLL